MIRVSCLIAVCPQTSVPVLSFLPTLACVAWIGFKTKAFSFLDSFFHSFLFSEYFSLTLSAKGQDIIIRYGKEATEATACRHTDILRNHRGEYAVR